MSSGDKKDYETGYCKPPKSAQFHKGQSGNPKGRPKGKLNVATALQKALQEKVIITENGRRKTITKLEAAVKQLVNKAASGDLRALQVLAALARSAEDLERAPESSSAVPTEVDRKIMQSILKRFEGINRGGNDDESNED